VLLDREHSEREFEEGETFLHVPGLLLMPDHMLLGLRKEGAATETPALNLGPAEFAPEAAWRERG
jgi:hypothetical protein